MEFEWLQWIGFFFLSLAIFNFLFFPHSFIFTLCLFFYFILLILCNIFCFSEFILWFGWNHRTISFILRSCASSIGGIFLTFLFEQLVVTNCSCFFHLTFLHWALVYFMWYHFLFSVLLIFALFRAILTLFLIFFSSFIYLFIHSAFISFFVRRDFVKRSLLLIWLSFKLESIPFFALHTVHH